MTELLDCPICKGPTQWCNWCDCDGCHLITCENCGSFDLAYHDGHGQQETLEELREYCAKKFNNRLAKSLEGGK